MGSKLIWNSSRRSCFFNETWSDFFVVYIVHILLQIQGDYTRKQCCFLCGALQWIYRHGDPDGLPNDPSLLYSNFGEEAAHRQTFLATI